MNKETIPEDERRIMKVFNVSNPNKIPSRSNEAMKAYFHLLSEKLIFPIEGEFEEETAPMHIERHSILLNKLSDLYDDLYGILAEGRIDQKKVVVPLVDFTPKDNGDNSNLIDDYKTWFCNY